MFNENNTIEKMVIETLKSNGWKYVPAEELPRNYSDVIVEPMVKDALIRLNPEIAADPSRAYEVIDGLRAMMLPFPADDLVAQNKAFKEKVFEENAFPFGEDGRMVYVKYFGTITKEQLAQNEYVVTNQWKYQQQGNVNHLDIVLLINGFPVAVGELKTPARNSITWLDGANSLAYYEQNIPEMFVTNIFNFATEGKSYRYGSVGMPVNMWGPWHTPDNKTESGLADVKMSLQDMITPEKMLDIFQFFTLFTTEKEQAKNKVICRYPQYEAANLIIQRVMAGYPKQGLIWQIQGSGKTLTMAFAAQKLSMMPELKNPSIVIVCDRLVLETQIAATFNASDAPKPVHLATKKDVKDFFKQDIRKIAITNIFRFGDADGVLNPSDNIIVMVDEAHRTHKGKLGSQMRMALPNAFFFGFTGTPINRIDGNIFMTFSATEDKSGYLSKYTLADSIRDNAALPLSFVSVPIDLHVNKEILEAEFDAHTKALSDAERSELLKRTNMKSIMYDQKRISKVCEHIVKHYKENIAPKGYKGQIVVYDRECCLRYKDELDKLLPPEATTIVMDTNNDEDGRYHKYRRSRDEEERILDQFRDRNDPLKLVIVTSKLLNGFDAPILQVMYLDKPMKDHNLLQAICRTNRIFDEGKTLGLIVDYIGIFDNIAKVMNFDETSMKKVITNIEEVKKQVPALIRKCLSHFMGVDRTVKGFEGLLAAQECIPTNKEKDAFAADYRVLSKAWETLSPDEYLEKYRFDYIWLSKVYESLKPVDNRGALIWTALGAKTLNLVHANLDVDEVHEGIDVLTLDANLIDEFIRQQQDVKKTAKIIELELAARIRTHSNDYELVRIGKKLEDLRDRHEQGLDNNREFLKLLIELAKDASRAEKEVMPDNEIDRGKAVLTEFCNDIKSDKTPIIVERLVADIDDIVKAVRFDGWQNTTVGKNEVKKALRSIIWIKHKIKDKEAFDQAYSYIEQYY